MAPVDLARQLMAVVMMKAVYLIDWKKAMVQKMEMPVDLNRPTY